jgi:type II secretory ATPase GspE/PulE/Tfp pilus assembly ATPase PilB-like protein
MYRYAKASGMITMYEDGMEKVEKNITTKAEILRVLHD